MNPETLRGVAAGLITQLGLRGQVRLESLVGGANNGVFRLSVDGCSVLLKAYFHHRDDPRNRLESEYRFVAFAWKHGVHRVPRPLVLDSEHRVALYEYVEGRPIVPGEVDEARIRQALDFYHELNSHRGAADAAGLAHASEAYFTFAEHLRGVEERVRRLTKLDDTEDVGRAAAGFVEDELTEAWDRTAAGARDGARRLGLALEQQLAWSARCLSPSDFGFHNALLERDGRLRFVDFEYAGWDDPAKLVCDFFCQASVPVPEAHYEWFADEVVRDLPEPAAHRERIGLLLPVYRIKWCCILLNDFLPLARERRQFTQSLEDEHARKARQLEKARLALRRVARA